VDFYVLWQTEKLILNASGRRQRDRGVTINKHKEDRTKLGGGGGECFAKSQRALDSYEAITYAVVISLYMIDNWLS
jgi:hypothetical protein